MNRRRTTALAASTNPWLMWTQVALKTAQMMAASAQVIGHRTQRMAAAGPNPSARDRREFARMAPEKIAAGLASGQAMTRHLALDPWLPFTIGRQMMATTAAMMSLAQSRTPSQALARQARLLDAVASSTKAAARGARSSARLASRGIDPFHARATANARRLGKR